MEIRSVSARAALSVTAMVVAVLIAIRFLWVAHAIFIIAFLGMLLGLAMARGVDYLERIHVPRAVGAPVVLISILGVLVGLGFLLAPMIRDQTADLAKELPKAVQRIEEWIGKRPLAANVLGLEGSEQQQQQQQQQPEATSPQPGAQPQQQREQTGTQQPSTAAPPGQPGTQQPATAAPPGQAGTQQAATAAPPGRPGTQQRAGEGAAGSEGGQDGGSPAGGLAGQLGEELRGMVQYLFPVVSSVIGAIAGIIIIFFIGMYIAAQPGVYRRGLLHLVPHRARERAEETITQLRDTLRQWLIARVIIMIAVAILTGGALTALGIEGAWALGIIAGLLEFIPFFGPFLAALPAVGIALVDGPEKALWVAAAYLVIQQIEGNVLTPLLLENRLDIPPVLTVVAVAALGAVFGILGMLIAEPLLAIVLVTTKMLYVNDVVGDDVAVGKED